jgi:hypothetical protein
MSAADKLDAVLRFGCQLAVEARAIDALDEAGHPIPPGLVARHVLDFVRLARREWRRSLHECNIGPLSETAKRTQKRDRKALRDLASRYDATVRFDGDPRGYVVHIMLRSGAHNTFSGREGGWGIPV